MATHTTIIQHLAKDNPNFRAVLGDPTLNADWRTYHTKDALMSRYSILGAMGPDIFYAMLDYGGSIQKFENTLVQILGTFRCVSEVSGEVSGVVDSGLNTLTDGVWEEIQRTFNILIGILKDGVLDALIGNNNWWSLFLPLRQVDDYQFNWYWADFLHYEKTGCFVQKLLDSCQNYSSDPVTTRYLKAYSLGYLTHYVADTVGHPYINRIVESPWRNYWQRHHLVENFIDAYLWDHWHDASNATVRPGDEKPLDLIATQPPPGVPRLPGQGRPLHFARLNDLCNVGTPGIDATLDKAIAKVVNEIQNDLFKFGLVSTPVLEVPDDPSFVTWANFLSDAIWSTYSTNATHPSRLANSSPVGCPRDGFPSAEDIMGAYGAYRLVLAFATEEDLEAPQLPNITGDLQSLLNQIWSDVQKALGSVQAPPAVPSSGALSLQGLWDALKACVQWLGQVAIAALAVVARIVVGFLQAVGTITADLVKVALWFLNSTLYSLYHSVRMPLVLSAYSVPLTEDLTGVTGPLDLTTLWKVSPDEGSKPYPVEPVLSVRDLGSNSTHPYSPYKPYLRPSDSVPLLAEAPAIKHPDLLLGWKTPDDMLEKPIGTGKKLRSVDGPAPPVKVPLKNPTTGAVVAQLESFDGSQRYFGGIFANCASALTDAIPYVSVPSTPMPAGTFLPDYNLDSDRGYAWPSWDVDFKTMLPWNGCDPYPRETIQQSPPVASGLGSINWGGRAPPPQRGFNLGVTDPFGNFREGRAFVNAAALSSAGVCNTAPMPFSFITVDPDIAPLDVCGKGPVVNPKSPPGNLTNDYEFAPALFLDANDTTVTDPTTNPARTESVGRLIQFLRKQTTLPDPLQVLANAVTLQLSATATFDQGNTQTPSPMGYNSDLVKAVAQLAVTGRKMYEEFSKRQPQDADLVTAVKAFNRKVTFNSSALAAAAHSVLDMAYTALWAIRSNEQGWRKYRKKLGWIAASGIDDTPHRPVNVPTAPYPQFDLKFTVQVFGKRATTRYLIASANTFVGPNDAKLSAFVDPANDTNQLLLAPPPVAPFSSVPAPRSVPADQPSIPAGDSIIVFIHGGGSRAEEAVELANQLILEGTAVGKSYTVISLDLPNAAYAATFDAKEVAGDLSKYDPHALNLLKFEMQFIIDFIEALDAQLGNVKDRIIAVMGGSLGGNMSGLLAMKYDEDPVKYSYLKTFVAWSVTSLSPPDFMHLVNNGDVSANQFLGNLKSQIFDDEHSGTEATYIQDMYYKTLINVPYFLTLPAQPVMWARSDDPGAPPSVVYKACKDASTSQSRFDRYEIYSHMSRHWTTAIDLELVCLSFQDSCRWMKIAKSPAARILLAAGAKDNYEPVNIYNSTLDVAHLMARTAHGKAEFWLDTGHSMHSERPRAFAKEIVDFLTHPNAVSSPNGVRGAPLPAPASRTDQ